MENEEQAWSQFAQSAMTMGDASQNRGMRKQEKLFQPFEDSGYPLAPASASKPPPQVSAALEDTGLRGAVMPPFQGTVNYRDGVPSDVPVSPSARMQRYKTPLVEALDSNPSALMDIIDSDASAHVLGSARTAPNDYRPNRVVKGSTRTSRVVRRTGMFSTTKHRDLMLTKACEGKGPAQKSEYVRKAAAEKIQRVWRAWYKYCQENSDWMTTTWICATMIQAKWRSYHVDEESSTGRRAPSRGTSAVTWSVRF
jgi:hypothetical protein